MLGRKGDQVATSKRSVPHTNVVRAGVIESKRKARPREDRAIEDTSILHKDKDKHDSDNNE
jgi:hypothetical protein